MYIIETETGDLYTGITNNLDRRFTEHKKNKKGARFFHFSSAKKIVYRELHSNRSKATKREIAIKKLSKSQKLLLISQPPEFI